MKSLSIIAITTVFASPVLAGGLNEPYVEPTIAPVVSLGGDWTGGYVGARLSYGDSSGSGALGGTPNILDGTGAVYGVQGGYLYDFGTYVMGAELNLNKADIDFDSGVGSIDNLHTFKVKAGYDAGRTLIFGSLGAAYADGVAGGTKYDDVGYVVGAGVEYMINDRVSLGGEVNYHRFDDIDNSGVDVGVTTVGATMNFRF
ncbi:outer membrane protein [Oceaniglobus ichthyenteri]|uniref:outer membrane protein n=1 Tax=Oceaniglobus ichthyenteri TaxID=2136177 RepID=UPI000D3755AF|nr:outer membrane beta-barrel protein [Oceaniglobus ichthyenteri]